MKIASQHTINAPVETVWSLMGERFGDVGEWSDTVIKSSLDGPLEVGAVRTCDLKPTPAGLDQIQEKITVFDPRRRTFAFDIITGLPGFMRLLNSEWRFEADGPGRTRAYNTLTIKTAWYVTPMWPVMRAQFTKTIRLFVGEVEAAARRPGAVESTAVAL